MTIRPSTALLTDQYELTMLAAALTWALQRSWKTCLLVVLGLLFVLVVLGAIDPGDAFSGLGHPGVVTVAAVLVISQALVNAGVVDTIARPLTAVKGGVMVQVMLFTGIVALLSAFMNNVGALALLMPVAIKLCKDRQVPPSKVLMPMAFGSLLVEGHPVRLAGQDSTRGTFSQRHSA